LGVLRLKLRDLLVLKTGSPFEARVIEDVSTLINPNLNLKNNSDILKIKDDTIIQLEDKLA